MKKMFFFDIDGTLIDCKNGIDYIPETTINSLNKLKENGDMVFLSTGRCKCFILDDVISYPFDGIVSCNGAYVEYKGKEVYKKVIDSKAIKLTHDLAKKYNWLYYFENSDKIYALDKEDKKHVNFRDNWKMKPETIYDDFDFKNVETYIGMVVLNNESEIEILQETLSPYFYIQRHQHGLSFDLTIKGESKGQGIRKMIEYLGLDMKDTIAFGDGRNDLEMLESVHLGIAMGNAASETKEVSDYITVDVQHDGITYALKEFSFIKND